MGAVLAGIALAGAQPARAAGDDVLRDCVAGSLRSDYSAADYRDALAAMPADVSEYSDCREQILAAALEAQLSAGDPAATRRAFGDLITGSAAAQGVAPRLTFSTVDPGVVRTTTPPTSYLRGGVAVTSTVSDRANPDASSFAGDNPWPAGSRRPVPLVPVALAFGVIAAGIVRAVRTRGLRASDAGAAA